MGFNIGWGRAPMFRIIELKLHEIEFSTCSKQILWRYLSAKNSLQYIWHDKYGPWKCTWSKTITVQRSTCVIKLNIQFQNVVAMFLKWKTYFRIKHILELNTLLCSAFLLRTHPSTWWLNLNHCCTTRIIFMTDGCTDSRNFQKLQHKLFCDTTSETRVDTLSLETFC